MKWINIKKKRPEKGIRFLVCDNNGFVDIEDTKGKAPFDESWKNGNWTEIVAWMPLPSIPTSLCDEDADGEMP